MTLANLRRLRWPVTLAVGVLLLAMGRNEQPQILWRSSLESALKEAKERNVPLFISFHQDG